MPTVIEGCRGAAAAELFAHGWQGEQLPPASGAKNVIISSVEVEQALTSHPAVFEATNQIHRCSSARPPSIRSAAAIRR